MFFALHGVADAVEVGACACWVQSCSLLALHAAIHTWPCMWCLMQQFCLESAKDPLATFLKRTAGLWTVRTHGSPRPKIYSHAASLHAFALLTHSIVSQQPWATCRTLTWKRWHRRIPPPTLLETGKKFQCRGVAHTSTSLLPASTCA